MLGHSWWGTECWEITCLKASSCDVAVPKIMWRSSSCDVAWSQISIWSWLNVSNMRFVNFDILSELTWFSPACVCGYPVAGFKNRCLLSEEWLPSALQLGHSPITLHYECIIHKLTLCDRHSFIHAASLLPLSVAHCVLGLSVGLLG